MGTVNNLKLEMVMDNLDIESLKQRAASWDLITDLLDKLEPSWLSNNKTGQQAALDAISKIASERDALRAQLETTHHELTATTISWENALEAPVPAMPIQDHEIAETINSIRDIAVHYRDTQQLREQIASILRPLLRSSKAMPIPKQEPAGAVRDQLKPHTTPMRALIRYLNRNCKDDWVISTAKQMQSYIETPSPRITEQDAREIINAYIDNKIGIPVNEWLTPLLNKLNIINNTED
jgi:uncharacterized protein YhaN